MHQVLFLTNDAGACALLVLQLVRGGCTVRVASTDALQEMETLGGPVDVIVAELDLGDPHSELILRALSSTSARVPLLVLTPSAPLEARLRAFDAGVDDVLVVPCAPPELVARIKAVMRRTAPREVVSTAQPVSLGAAVLYPESRALVRDGCTHVLRPKEYALLAALLERRGRIVPRRELLAEVWGYAAGTTTRTVDTHIVRLRRLVERDPARPQLLLTVTKLGYRLALDTEARRAS
jgi:DNA-binding response OmpR family regulator